MRSVIHPKYQAYKSQLLELIRDFNSKGELLGDGDRNIIKIFDINDKLVNVKSFKVPNLINKFAYRFIRKGKAQRSYEFANKLLDLGIGTPFPIGYFEEGSAIFYGRSFYISEQLNADLTYRELTFDHKMQDHEVMLRAFTRFTYDLHEKGVNFLDHSPGNTLIKKSPEGYEFFLVDLNRMKFQELDFETRIKNFRKLTIHKNMIEVMSDEYAKCSGYNFDEVFDLMWSSTNKFQHKFHRKRKIKSMLKFWK